MKSFNFCLSLFLFFFNQTSFSQAIVASLNCGSATHIGTLTSGVAASGVSTSVPYTGGNGVVYSSQTISSTGVTGLTATRSSGTLLTGSGSVTYTISGTPSISGTASFAITLGGQTCTFTRTVGVAATVTTLSCATATNVGTLTTGVAASGVSTSVPYTGGNSAAYGSQSVSSTGVTGLTATRISGTLLSGSGSVTYTISGTPSTSGTASFAITLGGQTCTFTRTVGVAATVTTLSCATATNVGTLTSGVAASGVITSVPYTGGNSAAYGSQSVSSTGVTGLTATRSSGTLLTGSGSVTYTISGTPSTSGTASFAITLGGQTCTFTRTVGVAATVTTLSCATATNVGTLTTGVAASGVSTSVPYTGGNGVVYASQTISSTGVTGLTATRSSGTLLSGSGSVTYTISGTPSTSGTASFAITLGGQTCTFTRTVGVAATVTTLSCATATNVGTLTSGVAASGVSTSVPYTGGNGAAYGSQSVSSTGVTGLTATRSSGTLLSGSGSVTYTISGTPSTSGTASFAITLGGQICTFTRTVGVAATVTTLSCATATNVGTLTTGVAASGVSTSVPYTGGNGAAYGSQSVSSTGVTGLTATRIAGTLLSGSGSVTYTISGTPSTSGTASFAITLGGQTCTFTRTVGVAATVTTLSCATATNVGTLTTGVAASGVSTSVPYTGGNGVVYASQTISSTGVTGLTATRSSGTLLSGSGSVTYTISGTPSTSGTASFAITLGGQTCTFTRTVGVAATVTTLSCATATNVGTLTTGVAASGVSTSVPYTGGNGVVYASQTISSTGVTGLTATRSSGTLLSGSGSVTYMISGTPSTSGTASFAITLGGQICTFTRTVGVAATVTTLSCATATNVGTLTTGVAASGVSTSVPYTGGNGVVYASQTISSTGVTGLTATRSSGTLLSGSGSVTYTISGTPSTSGTASFSITLGGQTCTFTRTVGAFTGTVTSFNCSSASYVSGDVIVVGYSSNTTFSFSYAGGNGGSYGAQSIQSTGVLGLTATRAAGTLANGSGMVNYTITGTPNSSGSAGFSISLGGQNCVFNYNVQAAGFITELNCSGAINYGVLIPNVNNDVASTEVISYIPYSGGNYNYVLPQTVQSSGVTGLTARLAGAYLSFSGTFYVAISGTPSAAGTASFALNIGGQSCILTRQVIAIGSVSSLNCANTSSSGSLFSGAVASGVSFSIPYSGANGGSFTSQSVNSTGVLGLTASRSAGLMINGSGTVTYVVSGTPQSSGNASFAINYGGQNCTIVLAVNLQGAISSLNCSGSTNSGSLVSGRLTTSGYRITFNASAAPATLFGISPIYCHSGIGTSFDSDYWVYKTGNWGQNDGVGQMTSAGNNKWFIDIQNPISYYSQNSSCPVPPGSQVYKTGMVFRNADGSIISRDASNMNDITVQLLSDGSISSNYTGMEIFYLPGSVGVSASIPYSGGNGGVYDGQIVSSTGVMGLKAYLLPGSFAVGAGTLNLAIVGTPQAPGIASFFINVGGQTCNLTLNVSAPVVGSVASLNCATNSYTGSFIPNVFVSGGLKIKYNPTILSATDLVCSPEVYCHSGAGLSSTTAWAYTVGNWGLNDGVGQMTEVQPDLWTLTIPNLNAYYSQSPAGPIPVGSSVRRIGMVFRNADGTLVGRDTYGNDFFVDLNADGTISSSFSSGVTAEYVSGSMGVVQIFNYAGGNGGPYGGLSISSTGVTGLTAHLAPGNFSLGNGYLTFYIAGTPSGAGNAVFTFSIAGINCSFTRQVTAAGTISSLSCSSVTNYGGAIAAGLPIEYSSSYIPYTGGNGGPYPAQTIPSTGVTGLTASLYSNNFSVGNGSLPFYIEGTPSGAGTASFAISVGGRSCTLTRIVVAPGTVTSLSCSAASHTGSFQQGVSISNPFTYLPYSGGNGGPIYSQMIASTGVTGITAYLSSTNLANGNGTLTFSFGGTPLSSGLAYFTVNIGGQTCTFSRTVSAGIIEQPGSNDSIETEGLIKLSAVLDGVVVYPNPANELLNIEFNATAETNVDVYIVDMLGRTVYSQKYLVKAGQNQSRLNLLDISDGMYVLICRDQDGFCITRKFEKE